VVQRRPWARPAIAFALIALFVALMSVHAVQAADKVSGVEIRIGGEANSGANKGGLSTTDTDNVVVNNPLGHSSNPRIVTSFTRLIIVSHFLRQASWDASDAPNQVLIGLALFSYLFIMQPVGDQINQVALQPMLNGKITEMQALDQASVPLGNSCCATRVKKI